MVRRHDDEIATAYYASRQVGRAYMARQERLRRFDANS
jgi:hypothetical protein